MNDSLLWDGIHKKYATQDWIDKPSIFAQWSIQHFPIQGNLLDLGAGQGQDSRWFAKRNYQVISTDYSDQALEYNKNKAAEEGLNDLVTKKLDLSNPFDFADQQFDIVYSHLAIHYFSHDLTQQIFNEIYRVLKPDGIIALLVNSVNDPEFKTGKGLEEFLWEISPGFSKRFFNEASMAEYAKGFTTLVLDNKGETYKDKAVGVGNLIRFVGRK